MGKKGHISYRFTTYLGRDPNGKQIIKTKTWHPPSNLTPTKARKAAEKEASRWESELLEAPQEEIPAPVQLSPVPVQPSRSDDFVSFMNDVWFPLEIEGSDRKPKTVYAYKTYLIIESAYFKGKTIQEITSIDIQQFLRYLRKEYHGQYGIGLKPKTVHHHYNLLNLIFAYAQEQEIGQKESEYIRKYRPILNTQIPNEDDWEQYEFNLAAADLSAEEFIAAIS